jgi:hypothetical protein
MIAAGQDAGKRPPGDDGTSAGLMNTLHREFPGWQFDMHPGGLQVWTASWRSEDGRHERYIVASSDYELLARLRVIGHQP